MVTLVLSSSSHARKALLQRLRLPFEIIVPDIDESPQPNETPRQLVERLAIEKAKVHAKQFKDALIIGSDQVALIHGKIIGKPDNHQHAVEILTQVSGHEIQFYTGLCLYNTKHNRLQSSVEKYTVVYKDLNPEMIENYLHNERPYHCAGSIRVEGLGIALMKELRGIDPTTLTGLPLIALVDMLLNEGVRVV